MSKQLPPGWVIAELGDLCKVEYGKGLSKKQRVDTGEVEVFGSAGLSGYHNEALMDEPVVIVGRKGNAGMVWVTQGPSWPIDTTYFLRPPQGVSAKYLSLQLGHLDLVKKDSSTTIPSLRRPDLETTKITLAAPAEQERIVDTIEEHFSRIDAVESAAQTALAKLDTLRQTILTTAFSGRLVNQDPDDESASILLKRIAAERPQHLTRHVAQGANQVSSPMTELLPSGWAIVEVGDLCKVEYGKGLSKKQRVGTGTVEVYGSAGLSGYHNEALMDEPVVIVGRKGNAGMVWVTQGPSWPIDTTYFLRPPQGVSAKYLSLQLGHLDLVKKDSSTTIPSLRRPDLETTTIAIAPSSEQEQIIAVIEEYFSRIDAAKASLERCLQRCSVLRRAVLAAAFSGRLVEQDSNDEPASALLKRIAAEQPKRRTRKKSA